MTTRKITLHQGEGLFAKPVLTVAIGDVFRAWVATYLVLDIKTEPAARRSVASDVTSMDICVLDLSDNEKYWWDNYDWPKHCFLIATIDGEEIT